jgi:AraC family transcriptional regulator
MLLRIENDAECGRSTDNAAFGPPDCGIGDVSSGAIDIIPAHAAERRAIGWDGIRVEIVQCLTGDKVEFRYRAPCHLLLVYQEGVRDEGETLIEGLAPSSVRTLRGKLTFVPAGYHYCEWQRSRVRSRIICFYFDPAKMPMHSDAAPTPFPSRMYFENNALWETAVKLATAIEDGAEAERYSEALAVVVAHELSCANGNIRRRRPLARGGLAVWQQRIVEAYIEENLCEPIPLAVLATLVGLSSYHFCRAFKRSVGVPPHRYHVNRRIERAKTLLANPSRSVTETALELGFSETSSFSAAFRQATGATPSEYRRRLG